MAIPNGSGEIGGCTPLGVALVVRESPASWYLRSMRYIRLTALLLLAACGDGGTTPTSPPTPPTPVATSITLSATTLSFASLGATQQLSATVKDQNGATMASASVTWSTSAASVATVSASGLVTAVASGTATITATAGSANGTAGVTVTQAAANMVLSDTVVTFSALGDTSRVTATVQDQNRNDISGATATWATSDTTIAIVSSSGLITSVAEGAVLISATMGSLSAGIAVTVTQVPVSLDLAEESLSFELLGTSLQLTAEASDGNGYSMSDTIISWATSNGSVAAVSGSGLVTTVGGGTAQITATAGALEASASVSITVWSSISTGGRHTCGINSSAAGYCWGNNDEGQLGDAEGLKVDYSVPTEVSGGHSWQSISPGMWHTCGVTTDGVGYCWGNNNSGKLGTGDTHDALVPTVVKGNHTWRLISAGNRDDSLPWYSNHTCGVTTSDIAYCWGWNSAGQLGDGTSKDRFIPTLVSGGHKWKSISVSREHTCGLTTSDVAYCWGSNGAGRLGDGTTITRPTPTAVHAGATGGAEWESISTGYSHTCGLTTSGIAYCWGWNWAGALGTAGSGDYHAPGRVIGGHRWSLISAGIHTCGITTLAEAGCWGENHYGGLGDGTTTDHTAPAAVRGNHTWASIAAGNQYHTCGVTTSRALYCWGLDDDGQLGNGIRSSSLVPNAVITPW